MYQSAILKTYIDIDTGDNINVNRPALMYVNTINATLSN